MENLNKFYELVENQFKYGGKKYAQTETKEATDVLFDDFGRNWLYGTMAKYCKRYSNLARERDLLKIACYMFILWLKRGFQESAEGSSYPINTTVEIKTKYFLTFKNRVELIKLSITNLNKQNPIGRIYNLLKQFANRAFSQVKERELVEIFLTAYYIWNVEIKNKGNDLDTYNEERNG